MTEAQRAQGVGSYPDLNELDTSFLTSLTGRSNCAFCKKSRKYYCYTCFKPIPELENSLPSVKLPIAVDIVQHPGEVLAKSTAVHAALLAPGQVNIHTFPIFPDFDKEKTILVFPKESARRVKELCPLTDVAATNKMDETKQVCEKRKRVSGETAETVDIRKNDIGEPCSKEARLSIDIRKNDIGEPCSKEARLSMDIRKNDIGEPCNIKDSGYPCENSLVFTGAEEVGGSCDITCANTIIEKALGPCDSPHVCTGTDEARCMCESSFVSRRACEKRAKVEVPFDRVVFIDSTWHQAHAVFSDERLKDLPCVVLEERQTKYWRTQKNKPTTWLSTIEAIYFFFRELFDVVHPASQYDGRYDELLWFFKFMYEQIRAYEQKGSAEKDNS